MATLLNVCRVSPPASGGTNELTLPLSFFDIIWVHFPPIPRILFYDHPCSKSEFLDTIVPKLKQSLSLTLKHYLPAAGNLIYPTNTADKRPVIRYTAGDSVQLIIAESGRDFDELTANHAQDSDKFYEFLPEIPPVKDVDEYKLVPLLSLQATLLPGRGICLGVLYHHSLGDAKAINSGLIYNWASINKFGGDEGIVSLPNFDRCLIHDSNGAEPIFWKIIKQDPFKPLLSFPLPTNQVRATYTFRRSDIEKLKRHVLATRPSIGQVSSFVVTISHVWRCLVKSQDHESEDIVFEKLTVAIDVRGRMKAPLSPPVPVPENYFGNCIGLGFVTVLHEKLVGEDGLAVAAEAVTEEIKKRVNDPTELMRGTETWMSEMNDNKALGIRNTGIAGSPKYDLGFADFGWGKARKMENLTLDMGNYTSIYNSNESGGLDYGISLPIESMEVFAAAFFDGLNF